MYLCILALGAPVMIFTTSMGNVVRAEGAVKEGMTGNLISTLTNVVLDALFGVTGNICAHIAADTLAALVGVILAVRQYKIQNKTLIA